MHHSEEVCKQARFLPLLAVLLFLFLGSCRPDLEKTKAEEFRMDAFGEAQGTTWQLVYYDLQGRDFKPAIDSILARIDQSISTYKPGSVIDRWNRSDSGAFIDGLFLEVLRASWSVFNATGGAFDPSVKPLVSYWGFGPEKFVHPDQVDSAVIDSLRNLRCFDRLRLVRNKRAFPLDVLVKDTLQADSFFLEKPVRGAQLDFNAIGQGWSVDKVVDYLQDHDIRVYFFELGGEIRSGYPKPGGELWRFGIDKPVANLEKRDLQAVISLRNKGLATSGNYRKFYEKDGVRYAHTINPVTGFPVEHNLLSATVVAGNTAMADAYATAFMVMGQDSTIRFLEERSYLSNYVYLVSSEGKAFRTFTSPEIIPLIEEK